MSTTDDDEMVCGGVGGGHNGPLRWPPRGPLDAKGFVDARILFTDGQWMEVLVDHERRLGWNCCPDRVRHFAEIAAVNPCVYHPGRNLLATDAAEGGRYFLSPGWVGPTPCPLVHRSIWD